MRTNNPWPTWMLSLTAAGLIPTAVFAQSGQPSAPPTSSAVQQQLRMLYEKDGRPLPPEFETPAASSAAGSSTNFTPATNTTPIYHPPVNATVPVAAPQPARRTESGNRAPSNPAQATVQAPARPPQSPLRTSPAPAPAPKPAGNPVSRFFKRLIPGRNKEQRNTNPVASTSAPAPTDDVEYTSPAPAPRPLPVPGVAPQLAQEAPRRDYAPVTMTPPPTPAVGLPPAPRQMATSSRVAPVPPVAAQTQVAPPARSYTPPVAALPPAPSFTPLVAAPVRNSAGAPPNTTLVPPATNSSTTSTGTAAPFPAALEGPEASGSTFAPQVSTPVVSAPPTAPTPPSIATAPSVATPPAVPTSPLAQLNSPISSTPDVFEVPVRTEAPSVAAPGDSTPADPFGELPPLPEPSASPSVTAAPARQTMQDLSALPDLPATGETPAVAASPAPQTPAEGTPADEFSDAFPEMSEDAADDFEEAEDDDEELEEDPFSGLSLEDAQGARPVLDQPAAATSTPVANELPLTNTTSSSSVAVEQSTPTDDRDLPRLDWPASVETPTAGGLNVQTFTGAAENELPPAAGVAPANSQDNPAELAEKMRKITSRTTMKGLKGFCPVTLRDRRELVDASPHFSSTYRGQKFHFASDVEREQFDEEPARYAPAAYGADVVVLTRDKDVAEGTLDHAAWYKGRLYLFGSPESHEVFIGSPASYAAPEGIE